MQFTYEELKNITNAEELIKDTKNCVCSISTDTRTITPKDVYLPLCGETFDGEKFIGNALEKGACGYFTKNRNNVVDNAGFALKVDDTKIAYLELANAYKKQVNPTTIAITGSSGKTTTKEIFNAVFSANRRTHKSQLNHNNEIGLCQTLLSMPEDTEVLIVEMGMRGLGEIELLSKYAQPDYAVITNIGTAHIGRLGSRENIAKAKCEIVKHLNADGTLITHSDELYKNALCDFHGKHIEINMSSKDYELHEATKNHSKFSYKGSEYTLKAGGEYNIQDALLAIETALLYGLSPSEIQKGLDSYQSIEKRFEEENINGIKVINDSYNANPDSMKAAIKTFVELYEGDKVLVLADMKELGEKENEYHKEIGQYLNTYKNDLKVFSIGDLAKHITEETTHFAKHFSSNIEAAKALKELSKGTTILLKGSRSMKLEEIIEEMKK